MLKIKKDVPFEELEKFGFEYNPDFECYCFEFDKHDGIVIDDDKTLSIYTLWHETEISTKLYDIITAGLVEKVEEE